MMNIDVKAFLFDLNGTMVDDMKFHTKAWYDVLNNDLQAGLSREEIKPQMYGKNEEVLIRIFGPGRFSKEEIEAISAEKEKRYQRAFLPHLQLINGLDAFLKKAHEHQIKMAIASAAITSNIDFVIDNLNIRHYFSAIVSADDVKHSKPDPETFLKPAQLLNIKPENCIVFEDVPKGVEAALNAGMKCVVITTTHKKEDFIQYPNVLLFIEDYTDPFLNQLSGIAILGKIPAS